MKKIALGWLAVACSTAALAQETTTANKYGNLAPAVAVGGTTASATLNQVSTFLANQLANNRDIKNVSDSRIAVASFVNFDNLDETNKLGMELAENMMHEMHVRGFGVVDFKTREALKVKANGDFVFSRDINELRKQYNIHYFLSGTISRNVDGAVINARLVQADTSLIVSTAQGFLANRDLQRILSEQGGAIEKVVIERPVIPPLRPNSVSLR
jgi:TolB-like protein